MDNENKLISMDEAGLVEVLNLIFSESTEDRKFAIENYKTLRERFDALSPEDFGAIQSVMGAADMAESMERFLKASTNSIDKKLKVAKIVADSLLFKGRLESEAEQFTDDDRNALQDNIAVLMKAQEAAKESKEPLPTPLTLVPSSGAGYAQ